jgi:2-polyprenyl-6-methoxyphenol hydroxylase-like FAD-dependent oxidoreductase
MANEHWKARKVVIVGAGAVGATFAYALAQSGVADRLQDILGTELRWISNFAECPDDVVSFLKGVGVRDRE